MKSKEEIEHLAEKYANRFIIEQPFIKDMFVEVYTQCQLDMALQIQELQTKIEDLTAENEQYERELNQLTTKNK